MAAVHRIMGNHRNDLLAATVTSTAVKSSTDIRLVATTQTGNATVNLTGPYTGAADTVVDVEITDILTATVPRVSAPSFSGAGNGVMTLGTVTSGSVAQTITVKLTDTGILTVNAALNFDEVVLQAKATGDAGNGIQISIDRTALVFTESDFSLLRPLEEGKDVLEGPEYEWSTVAARSDGTIPDTAKRLTFGDDPTIYRQWKSYADGQWQYHLHPALERAMPKGTRIVFVTEGRTVTVSQGATTETYTDIITPYDLLAALQESSNLIEVVGVVTPDKQPGGMAMRELRARTDAHALPTSGDGSDYATGFTDITVGSNAATELVQATCWAISNKEYPGAALGKELWQVRGSVLGIYDTHAITGGTITIADADLQFTIPQKLPDGYRPDDINQRGRFRVQSISYVGRDKDEGDPPPICPKSLVLGVAATDKTLTCVYKQRPSNECVCEDMRPEGRLKPECLGLDFIDGEENMATDPGYITRLQTLATWHNTFTRSNTEITSDGELRSADYDLQLADIARDELLACLEDIYGGAVTTQALWEASWDSAMSTADSDLSVLETVGTVPAASSVVIKKITAIAGLAFVVDDYYAHNDAFYKCVTGGTNSLSAGGASSVLGSELGVIYPWYLGYDGTTMTSVGFAEFLCVTKEEALGAAAGSALDVNSVAARQNDPGFKYDPETWAKRITAACNVVRAVAGLPPKKGRAGTKWNPCWSDDGKDDYYWEINGTEYKPAFTNKIYHSTMTCCSQTQQEDVFATNEFAFALMVKCPERLKEGDTVVLVIGESGWPATYQVGDVLTLPVIAAAPLELAGGVDGNDTLTWAVNSSTAGALPAYPVPLITTPVAYTGAAAQFTITPGVIDFAPGDAFTFAIEGGHYRWRRDSGAWSGTLPIADSQVLADGLTLTCSSGPPPSLAVGDSWQWQVTQPFSPVAIVNPVINAAFEWTGSSVTLHAALPTAQAIPAVLIALHTLPLTATVTLAGSLNNSTWWTVPMTVQAGPMVAFLTGKTAQYLELRITGATGAKIGWWWAGTPFQPSHNASTLTLTKVYGMARGSGLNPAALYRGAGQGGELSWNTGDSGWLETADMTELLALAQRVKTYHDEPFALTPSIHSPTETALVVMNTDELEFTDVLRFQDRSATRYLSASIPLRAVLE